MKKILSILLVLVSLFFIQGCTEIETNELDLMPPTITGIKDITYHMGDPLPDFFSHVIATDIVDGDISEKVTLDLTAVNLQEAGVYTGYYVVKDNALNEARVSFTIIVLNTIVIDTEEPIFIGLTNLTYFIGDPLPNYLAGVFAFDTKDGSVTSKIVVDDSLVDYETPGIYQVTYRVKDKALNEAVEVIEIEVIDENELSIPEYLRIYYINDTHGALLKSGDQIGFSRMANVVLDEKTKNPNETLFIAGGDILQGALVSNYFKGASMIDALNMMELDAFVLGNHEFDWGLDVLLEYFNPETTNLKANFPLLGANVFLEGTQNRPEFVDAYTIIDKGGLKVGIIGLMGFGLEGTIATYHVEGYYFGDPIYWAGYYAEYLRDIEEVDIVIVAIHDENNFTNNEIAKLTGSKRVDALFNGHYHRKIESEITRTGVNLPLLQSSSKSLYLGEMTLSINEFKKVSSFLVRNLNDKQSYEDFDQRLLIPNQDVEALINEYYLIIKDLQETTIIQNNQFIGRTDLTLFISRLLKVETNSAIGFQNYGGTRIALPSYTNITVGTVYEISPFDNTIYTVELLGYEIKQFMLLYDGQYSGESPSSFDDMTYYKVAVNSYLFTQEDYPFMYGNNIENTNIMVRDLIIQELREQATIYAYFQSNNPIIKSDERPEMLSIFEDFRIYLV